MALRKTISQEMLAIGAKSNIGKITEELIVNLRSLKTLNSSDRVNLLNGYSKKLQLECGLKCKIHINSESYVDASVWITAVPRGHSGVRWYDNNELRLENFYLGGSFKLLEVDLKNVKVTGELLSTSEINMSFSAGLLNANNGYTVREITAIIMHEIGHVFNLYLYMGDYIWLNYYLTDGIEILQGKKQTKIKTEILNEDWLRNNIPTDTWEDFINDRSESNTRKVILSAVKTAPRHHLTNNTITAMRREEQMADMFVTRLGYGKDLATGLHRMDKEYDDVDHSSYVKEANTLFWFSLLSPLTMPFTLLFIFYTVTQLRGPSIMGGDMADRYDDPKERLSKMKRDLVAQLRHNDIGLITKEQLNKEINHIDGLLKQYDLNKTFFTKLTRSLKPSIRKMDKNTQIEEDLEELVNNDLFVKAFQATNIKDRHHA